ncbi:GIY-YIG nuclease family protein [Rhodococcus sp. BP22]|uniref:GIY-YIG nuclease family protein n=1 Tax=Rhodococcus sp. BP22 TaxID=2758566 RepID=UPI001644A126|nr:hypothetical protein [Rhodococcus sp. BP22]
MNDHHSLYLGAQLYNRTEVLTRPCPVPAMPGVYGWWFDQLPSSDIDTSDCQKRDGLTLLYAGISPSRPPMNGKAPSKQNIRKRIRYHYRGNAYGSTLRFTLGSLLSEELDIKLRRVGSGRLHFHQGEWAINDWMDKHAFVSWVTHPEPWVLEGDLIEQYDLPLNLMGNTRNSFHARLTKARSDQRAGALDLPVLQNAGKRP